MGIGNGRAYLERRISTFRSEPDQTPKAVEVALDAAASLPAGALPDDQRRYVVDDLVETLSPRRVVIEPAGLPASAGIELT